MKLKLIYLLLLVACAGLVLKNQTSAGSTKVKTKNNNNSLAEILKKDEIRLENNLSSEVLENQTWIDIKDFSLSVKSLLNKKYDTVLLFKASKQSIYDLARCLKKDYCGMESKNELDPYFDETKTPGHILLGRNLEILRETLKLDPNLKSEVDWEIINDLTSSNNEKIQVLAVELLKIHNPSTQNTEALSKIVDNFSGEAKAKALIELATDSSEDSRNKILSVIAKSFDTDDSNTVINIIESLPQIHLSHRELEIVANYLCHFKEVIKEEHNWKMILFRMNKMGISMDDVCP